MVDIVTGRAPLSQGRLITIQELARPGLPRVETHCMGYCVKTEETYFRGKVAGVYDTIRRPVLCNHVPVKKRQRKKKERAKLTSTPSS